MSLTLFHGSHKSLVWLNLMRKNCWEFVKTQPPVTFSVVLLDDLCDLILWHVLTKFLHCKVDVFVGDISSVVCIKLIEYGMHLLIGHVDSDVDCCRQKITIVNLLVSVIVDLWDDTVELIHIDFDSFVCQNISELIHVNHTSTSCVNCFKLCSQVFDFILRNHLDKHIHSSFLESRLTFKLNYASHHFWVNIDLLFSLLPNHFKPWMINGLLACQTLLWVIN